jgi:hypothetical protein
LIDCKTELYRLCPDEPTGAHIEGLSFVEYFMSIAEVCNIRKLTEVENSFEKLAEVDGVAKTLGKSRVVSNVIIAEDAAYCYLLVESEEEYPYQ